jgi:hypothetical protein
MINHQRATTQVISRPLKIISKPVIAISTDHVGATAGTAITPVTITNTGSGIYYYSISPAIRNPKPFTDLPVE